jgi:hypothetical protein
MLFQFLDWIYENSKSGACTGDKFCISFLILFSCSWSGEIKFFVTLGDDLSKVTVPPKKKKVRFQIFFMSPTYTTSYTGKHLTKKMWSKLDRIPIFESDTVGSLELITVRKRLEVTISDVRMPFQKGGGTD